MAFLHKRKKQGGRYYIRWLENGRVRSISTREKQYMKALEFFDRWRAGKGEIINTNFTLQDLFDRRLDFIKLNFKEGTYKIYAATFKNYLAFFPNRLLTKVLPEDLETYKKLRNVSKTTVNIEIRVLKATFKYACSKNTKMLNENPFDEIKQFNVPEKKKVYISAKEINLILDHITNSTVRDVIIHALNTGMRRGEILNLKYKDINLDNKTLEILETKTNFIRNIPISDQLYDQLYKYFYDETGCIRLYNPDERIYKVNGDFVTHEFKKVIRKLNLSDQYKFHSIRHTAITNLLRHSGNVYISMEIAGHKSIKTTQMYLHNIPEEVRAAVNSLSIK